MQQIFKITPVQRQVIDNLGLQCAAKFRVGSLNQGYCLGDRYLFGLFAGLDGEVHPQLAIDFQDDVLALYGLKTLGFGADGIRSRKQIRSVVFTGLIRRQRSSNPSLSVCDGYFRAYDHAAGLIGNAAQNSSGVALRQQGNRDEQYPCSRR